MTVTMQFRNWAERMAARFAAPVFLVGSAVYSDSPRDIDVRVVLPDEQFAARYGDVDAFLFSSPGQAWVTDIAKLTDDAVRRLRINLDLQVVPESEAVAHQGRPRKLLAAP